MELAKIRHAVSLTAQCRSIDFDWRAPPESRWTATLWCSQIGELVVASGPDEWAAVQAVHALRHYHANKEIAA